MADTLAELHAAVIAAPTDRHVRLVYADALDESGGPAGAVRAEFIRHHVALEAMPDDNPQRKALADRCETLFLANWINWWAPVCTTVGLPEPHVPRRRRRGEPKPPGPRTRRTRGTPYGCNPKPFSVEAPQQGFTAQFIAGFPEMLYVYHFMPDALARPFGNWFAAAPFCRLRFAAPLTETDWAHVDGPHLAKVSELTFDRFPAANAGLVARSEHLVGLATLKVLPSGTAKGVVRDLVQRPAWAGLRALTLSGTTTPKAIRALAERSTLEHLETLSFGIAEVPEPPNFGGLLGMFGQIAQVAQETIAQIFGQREPVRWPEYWPALEALARSAVLPRLRQLTIADAAGQGTSGDFLQFMRLMPGAAPEPAGIFPDTLVRALADGLDPNRLVRLELPAVLVSPAGRAELTRRFGPRAVLA